MPMSCDDHIRLSQFWVLTWLALVFNEVHIRIIYTMGLNLLGVMFNETYVKFLQLNINMVADWALIVDAKKEWKNSKRIWLHCTLMHTYILTEYNCPKSKYLFRKSRNENKKKVVVYLWIQIRPCQLIKTNIHDILGSLNYL